MGDEEGSVAGEWMEGNDVRADAVADFNRLRDMARDRTAGVRRDVASNVAALYLGAGGGLSARERVLVLDILGQVIRDAEMAVRRSLAERLANEADVPRELLLLLVDDDIEIAAPVLMRSRILTDEDLTGVVRRHALEHRLAVARRDDVNPAVGDALVETDEEEVMLALLGNPGARLSPDAVRRLVDQAVRRHTLCHPLALRPELTSDLAVRLYWLVSLELRRALTSRFTLRRDVLDRELQASIQHLVDATRIRHAPPPDVQRLAERLVESDAITPDILIQVLRAGQVPLFEVMFARMIGLTVTVVRRMVREPGGEALALACRMLRVDKGHFASIFLLSRAARPGEQIVDPRELSRVLAFYDRISPQVARPIVERWRRSPDMHRLASVVHSGTAGKA